MRFPRPQSLRRELVLWFVLTFVAMIAVSNLSLYYFLRLGINADRNAVLSDRLNAIAELLRYPESGPSELARRITKEWPSRQSETTFFRVIDRNGVRVAETPNFEALGLDLPEGTSTRDLIIRSADGRKLLVRFRSMEAAPPTPGPVKVIGAVDVENGETFLRRQRNISLGLTLLSALVSFLLAWPVTRRGLRPLEDMTSTVAKIDSENLTARLDLSALSEELRPLANAFNQTLERLEQSFERISRFSSNIAHELRTPVNNMLGELEVHLGRPRTEEEDHEILSSTIEECSRLHQIIESLLFLARAERPLRHLKMAKLDAVSILEGLIDFYEAAASEAGISLALTPGVSLALAGDRTLFQQAVGNLISNAIRYTPAEGTVRVALVAEGKMARISVEDSGIGISKEHLPHLLDRFYRADPSRDHSSGGFGLGLAITKSILELHGGQVEIESEPGRGTRVGLLWPLWEPEGSAE